MEEAASTSLAPLARSAQRIVSVAGAVVALFLVALGVATFAYAGLSTSASSLHGSEKRAVVNSQGSILDKLIVPQDCPLDCHNGGYPDAGCRQCENCYSGFGGIDCSVPLECLDKEYVLCKNGAMMNATTCLCDCPPGLAGDACHLDVEVEPGVEVEYMYYYLFNPKAPHNLRQKRSVQGDYIPTSVGSGRKSFLNMVTRPVIEFTPSAQTVNSPTTGHSFVVPDQVTFTPRSGEAVTKYRLFASLRNYLDSLFDWTSSTLSSTVQPRNIVESSTSTDELYTKFFTQGASLGVIDVQAELYEVALKAPIGAYTLDESVHMGLDYTTKENYPERKDMYFAFFENVGTMVVVSCVSGGSIEKTVRLKPGVWDIDLGGHLPNVDWIKDKLQAEFRTPSGSGNYDQTTLQFKQSIDFTQQICRGGSSSEQDCSQVTDAAQFVSKLWNFPVSVSDTVVPITELIKDPAKKAVAQNALIDFINFKRREYGQPPLVDDKPYTHPPPQAKCPPCKNGWCNEPSTQCTCFTRLIVGAKCDQCAGGWIGARCDVQSIYYGETVLDDEPCYGGGGRYQLIPLKRSELNPGFPLSMKRRLPDGEGCSGRPARVQNIRVKMTPSAGFKCRLSSAQGSVAAFPVHDPMSRCQIVDLLGFWTLQCNFIGAQIPVVKGGTVVNMAPRLGFWFEASAECMYS